MSERAPKSRPWLESTAENDAPLRAIMQSAALDEPSDATLDALGARIAAATSAAPIAPSASGAMLTRIAVAVLSVAVIGGGVLALRRAPQTRSSVVSPARIIASPPRERPAIVAPVEVRPAVATPVVIAPIAPVARPVQRAARVLVSDDAAAPTIALEDEATVLLAAMTALRAGDLAETERRIAQHRRDYPQGDHREERDRCAVELLLRQGRRAEAERAAESFRRAYPSSALQRRIDRLLQIDGDASIGS